MIVSYDFSEPDHFAKELRRIADKGDLETKGLEFRQMKSYWGAVGRDIVRSALPSAPKSGKTGKSEWSKSVTTGGFKLNTQRYRYEGKHGDLGKRLAYTVKPFRTGKGVRVIIGDPKPGASSQKKLAGIVGNMAVHNVKRLAGGTAKKGTQRDWVGDANRRTTPKHAKGLVELYHRSQVNQIKPGAKSRLFAAAADKTTGKRLKGVVTMYTSGQFHGRQIKIGESHPVMENLKAERIALGGTWQD